VLQHSWSAIDVDATSEASTPFHRWKYNRYISSPAGGGTDALEAARSCPVNDLIPMHHEANPRDND
jgi:hypothetical protein